MARKRKFLKLFVGTIVGLLVTSVLKKNSGKRDSLCSLDYEAYDASNIINDTIGEDNFLLVGVMTAEKYVNTRAKVVYETWGKTVSGKTIFFSSENSRSNDVPLVPLPKIDDSYPPQRKSFAMLKYMYENYIDKYEWFVRADDDVYIRTDRLEKLLQSVDSSKTWFIGQAGRGKPHEIGLLALDKNENYCMGGPGIILSKETLKRVIPNIDYCLQNLYSKHEDVELGRCVKKFAGVSCTWAYEMQIIFYHNQTDEAFSGNLKQKYIHSAITMHPIKDPQNMYRLHNYIKAQQVQEKQQEVIVLHRDISSSMSYFGVEPEKLIKAELIEDVALYPEPPGSKYFLGDPELLGIGKYLLPFSYYSVLGAPTSLNRHNPKTLYDVLEWELIAKSLYSYKDFNPKRRIGSSIKEGLSDVVREVMEITNSNSNQRGRLIEFKELSYVYLRTNPIHGADLILDMSLLYKKYTGNKVTIPVRRHIYVQQTFTGTFIRELPDTNDVPTKIDLVKDVISRIGQNLQLSSTNNNRNELVNFILPLSGRHETFKRFINVYENVCIVEQETARLIVVLYKNNPITDFEKNLNLIKITQQKYPTNQIVYKIITEPFSRGKALKYGVDVCRENDLMFFVDVDIVFNRLSLRRIRFNTVQRKQIYFPIVYSLYSPKFLNRSTEDFSFSKLNLDNREGFWRQFGFGITSIYKTDFFRLGGFNTSITGWGVEDVSFFEKVIKSDFKIIRTVDPHLVHIYHSIECDDNLEEAQKNMCIGTKANIFGSLYDVQNFYLKHRQLFR
ncbi:hypothetical protein FQR65_LT07048 [Abscondita terminalis]|nr:hypothetical protein FQR65_LT07048 [Abscondita terminalis]